MNHDFFSAAIAAERFKVSLSTVAGRVFSLSCIESLGLFSAGFALAFPTCKKDEKLCKRLSQRDFLGNSVHSFEFDKSRDALLLESLWMELIESKCSLMFFGFESDLRVETLVRLTNDLDIYQNPNPGLADGFYKVLSKINKIPEYNVAGLAYPRKSDLDFFGRGECYLHTLQLLRHVRSRWFWTEEEVKEMIGWNRFMIDGLDDDDNDNDNV